MRKSVVFYGPKGIDKMELVNQYIAMHNIPKTGIYQLSTLNIKDDGSPVDIWERDTELIVFPNIEYKHLRTIDDIASGYFTQTGTGRKGPCQVVSTMETNYDLFIHFGDSYARNIQFVNVSKLLLYSCNYNHTYLLP